MDKDPRGRQILNGAGMLRFATFRMKSTSRFVQ